MKFQEKRLKCTTVEVIHVLYLLLLTPEVILFRDVPDPFSGEFYKFNSHIQLCVTGKVLALQFIWV